MVTLVSVMFFKRKMGIFPNAEKNNLLTSDDHFRLASIQIKQYAREMR